MTTYRLKKSKKEEIKKKGNFTYKFINGEWREIYYKDNKFESWREYDDKGHLTHYKNNEEFEEWYDDKGEKITEEEFNKIWEKVE